MAKDPSDPPKNGTQVCADGGDERGPVRRVVTAADCGRALKLCKGDYELAAKVLGLSGHQALRVKVSNDPQLRAVWLKGDVAPPTEVDVIHREPTIIVESSKLGEAMMRQNREILRNGLSKAGIKGSIIEKLKVFDEFAPNAGEYLVASLDMSHRMMMYMNVKLLERAEAIEETYLNDETLDEEVKIEWQKAWNEIGDMIRKNYETSLVGTQAMAKMMGKDGEKKKKSKPGFKALKSVTPAKAKNG